MNDALRNFEPTLGDYLRSLLVDSPDWMDANDALYRASGIRTFFPSADDLAQCRAALDHVVAPGVNVGRREFGDYQTPPVLAEQVCRYLVDADIVPECVIEPTFGKGAFILAALRQFPELRAIHGVEIHPSYCWHTKLAVLEFFLRHPERRRPEIVLHNADVFRFDFDRLARELEPSSVLVLGNPPWVTSAELGSLDSTNLPAKYNLKRLNGLDARTGRSNFDISEYILLLLLDALAASGGYLAVLVKNAIVRNLLLEIHRKRHPVADMESLAIDAGRHFGASVDAALLVARLGADAESYRCRCATLDEPREKETWLGWSGDRLIADLAGYESVARYDGRSIFVWRQGVKHDASRIMELIEREGVLVNGLGERVELEEEAHYPLAKSSDVARSPIIVEPRRRVIVTQSKIGEETSLMLDRYPKLRAYLERHRAALDARRSSIYRNRPPFSMFGIGDYSFKPYKVAISGMYKEPRFALVPPFRGRPVMLDDTCYIIGFDSLTEAAFVWGVLRSPRLRNFLDTVAFTDAQRPFTKELLMRIDLLRVIRDLTYPEIQASLAEVDLSDQTELSEDAWQSFVASVASLSDAQTPARVL